MKISKVNLISLDDWDELVKETILKTGEINMDMWKTTYTYTSFIQFKSTGNNKFQAYINLHEIEAVEIKDLTLIVHGSTGKTYVFNYKEIEDIKEQLKLLGDK